MWGKVRRSTGRQLLQEEVSYRTSRETPVDATQPDKKGGKLGALEYDGAEGNQVPQGH